VKAEDFLSTDFSKTFISSFDFAQVCGDFVKVKLVIAPIVWLESGVERRSFPVCRF
jgi:hypothetical protein